MESRHRGVMRRQLLFIYTLALSFGKTRVHKIEAREYL
jgi:hypothetical protein